MRFCLILPLLAAGLVASALAQSASNPTTWNYDQNGNAALQGNAAISGNLTDAGTTTLNNLIVNGTTSLPAASITCSSLPALTGNVTTNPPSTGCATTIPAATVTNAMHANVASNSLSGNATGASAAPTDVPVPAATGSLRWTAGTGFVANAAGQLPADGSGTAPCSTCTGYHQAISIPAGSAVATPNATPTNVTSQLLAAGNWVCWGRVAEVPTVGLQNVYTWVSSTSATLPTLGSEGFTTSTFSSAVVGSTWVQATGEAYFTFATSTTVYLSTEIGLVSGSNSAYGGLSCIRSS